MTLPSGHVYSFELVPDGNGGWTDQDVDIVVNARVPAEAVILAISVGMMASVPAWGGEGELATADLPGKYRELVPELIVCVCDEKPKRKLALLATLRSDDSGGYSTFDPFGEAATGPPFQIVLTDENLKVLQTIVKGAASPPDLVVTRALIHTIFTRDVT